MTYKQKEIIKRMRGEGCSYAKIATALELSENTVKSFCRRNKLSGVSQGSANQSGGGICPQCGTPLVHTAGAKRKRFCSDKCRMAWWNAHPQAIRRKASYFFTCAFCGAVFESYGNKQRKYCSRSCYGKAKAKKHD